MVFEPGKFLTSSTYIDFESPAVARLASELASESPLETARRCFVFVRDEIRHSSDFQLNPVTCAASDVLACGTGFCYAKSHLLCALLRSNRIPAGLCYQRLSVDGIGPPYSLHGLNAVYLDDLGWYRIDARGNRDDVDAQFDPPIEKLAFEIRLPGEKDLDGIFDSPLAEVVDSLQRHRTWDALVADLPDVRPDSHH